MVLHALGQSKSAGTASKEPACPIGTPAAVDLGLTSLDGAPLKVPLRTSRPLLLVFWTPWAPPSAGQLRVLASAEERWRKGGLDQLSVALGTTADAVKKVLGEGNLTLPAAVAKSDDKVRANYSFNVVPASFLIDARGLVASCYVGVVTTERVDADLARLSTSKTKGAP